MTQQSVIKAWVFGLPLRMQTVLLSAIRSADGLPNEDKSKALVRVLCDLLLHNADPASSFMKVGLDDLSEQQVEAFANDLDHYYVHFLMHLTHAAEIVGYKHPDHFVRGRWIAIYKRICKALHLNFETEVQLDVRLGHTQEFLEQQKKQVEKVTIPAPPKSVLPSEIPKSDRPIELDLEGGPVPRYAQAFPPKGKCTCSHGFIEHYELRPETQPGVYECSGTVSGGGKCKCVKYDEAYEPKLPVAGPRSPNSDPSRRYCICGHSELLHQILPSGRCSASGCERCISFVEREMIMP